MVPQFEYYEMPACSIIFTIILMHSAITTLPVHKALSCSRENLLLNEELTNHLCTCGNFLLNFCTSPHQKLYNYKHDCDIKDIFQFDIVELPDKGAEELFINDGLF